MRAYWYSNARHYNQLTLLVATLILWAGVWIYHFELKASGLWAVFSLSSL